MGTLIRFGKLQVTPETEAKLRHMLQEPKLRSAVSRRLNDESRKIAAMCSELAALELHRRPDERRTELSLSHGKHYIDSFEAVPAKQFGVDRLKVAVTNTHPAHRMVEKGTRPHTISGRGGGKMSFPYLGYPAGHGGPRHFADWLVTGDDYFVGPVVDHPGAVGHEIMRRTLREYRRRAQRRLA